MPGMESWTFLGVALGYSKMSARTLLRIKKAGARVRRIASFSGSLAEKSRMVSLVVSGLFYGLSFERKHRTALTHLAHVV